MQKSSAHSFAYIAVFLLIISVIVYLNLVFQENLKKDISIQFNRQQVPVVGDMRDIGEAFRFRDEHAKKSELVIFLRPTVISNPSLESDELKFFRHFLPQAGEQQPDRTATP